MNYEKATEMIFDYIKNNFYDAYYVGKKKKTKVIPITFEDVDAEEWHVHFTMNICPDWSFGIWYNIAEEGKKVDELDAIIFAQYTRFIDKFKPSCTAPTLQEKFVVKDGEELDFNLDFLHCIVDKEPLAFWMDTHTYSGTYMYVGKMQAKRYMRHEILKDKREKRIQAFVNGLVVKRAKRAMARMPGCRVDDRGDCCSPRYECWLTESCFEPGELEVPDQDRRMLGCYGVESCLDCSNPAVRRLARIVVRHDDFVERLNKIFKHKYIWQEMSTCFMVWRDGEMPSDEE